MAVLCGLNGKIIQHNFRIISITFYNHRILLTIIITHHIYRFPPTENHPSLSRSQPGLAHLLAAAPALSGAARPTNCRALVALRGADQGEVDVVDGRLSHGTPRKAPVKAPPVADFNMFFGVLGGGGWVKGWVFVNFGWVLAEYWVNFEVFAGKNGWKLGLEAQKLWGMMNYHDIHSDTCYMTWYEVIWSNRSWVLNLPKNGKAHQTMIYIQQGYASADPRDFDEVTWYIRTESRNVEGPVRDQIHILAGLFTLW